MRERRRQNLMLMANLRVAGGEQRRVRVRDISEGGLKVVAPATPASGTAIRIELPHLGWLGGTVAWVKGGSFGIRLNAAIDPAVVRQPVTGSYVRPDAIVQPHLRRVA